MKSRRNFGLDVLRAAAISAVVLFHARPLMHDPPRLLGQIAGWGWFGVDLFFVLSGFLIAGQVAGREHRRGRANELREFWIKRWTRTFPLYFVVLAVYFALSRFDPVVADFRPNWRWLLFLQNWHDVQGIPQSWSLCIEEQFYLVFPLLFLLLPRLPAVAWLLPMLCSWAYRAYHAWYLSSHGLEDTLGSHGFLDRFRFTTLASLDAISCGVFLALTARHWQAWSARARNAVGVAGLVLVFAVMSADFSYSLNPFEIVALYAGLAVGFSGLLVAFERIHDAPRWGAPITAVALWSYSTYLWQPLVFDHLEPYATELPWALLVVGGTAIVLVVSWLSYRFIEVSGMSLRTKLLAPRPVKSPS